LDKEVSDFLDSLTIKELGDYDILTDNIESTSVFMSKVYRDGKLVAVGGIAKWYHLFYHTYFMVKSDYQSQGIGNEISQHIEEYAERHHLPYIIGAFRLSNAKSTRIHSTFGYEKVWSNGKAIYGIHLFNKKWSWFSYVLKRILPVYKLVCRKQGIVSR
jgi:GNAT superfamily N-acetyltransferase